jgi:predicted permease
MSAALATLLPILALIALGGFLGRTGLIEPAGWRAIDKLLFHVLFPALMVEAVARAGGAGSEPLVMAAILGLSQATMIALALVLRRPILRLPGGSRPAFASFVQGVVRWNTAVAVAIVAAVYGSDGVVLIAFGIAVMVPIANLVSVMAMTVDGDNDHAVSVVSILMQLVRNPFLQAVAVGILLALSPVAPPRLFFDTLHQLAQAAPGIALLSVGAGLDLRRVAAFEPIAFICTIMKLMVMPACVFALAWLFGLGHEARAVALIAAAVPTASAGYVLARQMGGDADLMARIIALHTAVAVVTIPLIVALSG